MQFDIRKYRDRIVLYYFLTFILLIQVCFDLSKEVFVFNYFLMNDQEK